MRRRMRRHRTDEKGRPRNLVIPDSLYDTLVLYATKTKVKVVDTTRTGQRREHARSLTVSEAACKALASFLPKLSIVEDNTPSSTE